MNVSEWLPTIVFLIALARVVRWQTDRRFRQRRRQQIRRMRKWAETQ